MSDEDFILDVMARAIAAMVGTNPPQGWDEKYTEKWIEDTTRVALTAGEVARRALRSTD